MSVLEEAERLTAAGRRDEAVALVERAAAHGNAEALFAVGNWRLFGLFGKRDLSGAHTCFDRSAAQGFVEAIRTKAMLIGNGTGTVADENVAKDLLNTIRECDPYAELQLNFLRDMPPVADLTLNCEIICDRPIVKSCQGLLSERECKYLSGMAQPHLRPSYVTNPVSGTQMPHPIRSSTGMSFGPTQEDLVVRRINERIAAVSGTEVGCGEPLHILHYTPGQQYKPHTDGIPGEENQRRWTVLIYLNDNYSGGETSFPNLDINYRGAIGDALIFQNLDDAGYPDPATLHAGLPVQTGVKWIATRWIRTRPYHPWTS